MQGLLWGSTDINDGIVLQFATHAKIMLPPLQRHRLGDSESEFVQAGPAAVAIASVLSDYNWQCHILRYNCLMIMMLSAENCPLKMNFPNQLQAAGYVNSMATSIACPSAPTSLVPTS